MNWKKKLTDGFPKWLQQNVLKALEILPIEQTVFPANGDMEKTHPQNQVF